MIEQLRDQLCVPALPENWIAAQELAERIGIDISTLHRRMKIAGYQRKKYRVEGTRAPAVWCYPLTK